MVQLPPLLYPDRVADATIRGFLTQVYYTAMRWLDLGEREFLLCEGDEDIDRYFFGPDGSLREIRQEQIKDLSDALSVRSEPVHESLFNFLVSFVEHHKAGRRCLFLFVTNAPMADQRVAGGNGGSANSKVQLPINVLETWVKFVPRSEPEIDRDALIDATRRLAQGYVFNPTNDDSPVSKEKTARAGHVKEALEYLDQRSAWSEFLRSVEWKLERAEHAVVESKLNACFGADPRTSHAPLLLAQKAIFEILHASSRPRAEDRLLSRAGLDALARASYVDLTAWAEKHHPDRLPLLARNIDKIEQELRDQRAILESTVQKVDVLVDEPSERLRRISKGNPHQRFLTHQISADSNVSLIPAMRARLEEAFPQRVRAALPRRPVNQAAADRRLHDLTDRSTGNLILATAVAGGGKSTWSARHASARADIQPVVWAEAKTLRLAQPDPIGLLLVQRAFGSADVSRVKELADLLKRERLRLFAVVDAIDEVQDFDALSRTLQDFRLSVLARHVDVILTCREEAMSGLGDSLLAWRPDLLDARKGTRVRLEPVRERERSDFLLSEGASPEEARRVENTLPPEFAGVPLFLRHALTLAQAGSELSGDHGVIGKFADFAIEDIRTRLRRNGRAPTAAYVRQVLSEIALAAIATPTAYADWAAIQRILGEDAMVEGEDTFVGRATHVGLLEKRGDLALAFGHALYLDFFAAVGASTSWPAALPPLTHEAGRHIARRIARFLPKPAWLIRAMISIDPVAACDCCFSGPPVPKELREELVGAARAALESRFRSDRVRALRALGRLGGYHAKKATVDWWNSASQRERIAMTQEAATVFLDIEEIGAFDIILGNRYFHSEHPWFEPNFVRRIQNVSEPFRAAMIAKARSELRPDGASDARHGAVVALLALLGDQSFVEVLGERLTHGAGLTQVEIRALIHANTDRAMQVYAEFVEIVLAIPEGAERGPTDHDRRNQRALRRQALVHRGKDVRMHPHDALLELVEGALSSRLPAHIFFGQRYAELLVAPRLLSAYMSSRARLAGRYLDSGARLIERMLSESSLVGLAAMYELQEDPEIRSEIVRHAYVVPGPETERFLLERLDRNEHAFYAVQALGNLRAVRAAPAILRAYFASTREHFQESCLIALESLASTEVVDQLADALESMLDSSDAKDLDSELVLISTIGRTAGPRARDVLARAFPRTRHKEHALTGLFSRSDPDAIAIATSLVSKHDIGGRILAEALGTWEIESDWRDGVERNLADPQLLHRLLQYSESLDPAADRGINRWYLLRAVARFRLPEATAYLERVAEDPDHPEAASAAHLLAETGNERAVCRCIEDELKIIDQQPFFFGGSVERLSRWPSHLVREALLTRIAQGGSAARWLRLLQWFADDSDIALYEDMENGSDADAADVAHEFLASRRRLGAGLARRTGSGIRSQHSPTRDG